MFETKITPQFADLGPMRYIKNNVIGNWFEIGRNDIFRFFTPDLDLRYGKWKLIMLKTENTFINNIKYGEDVLIKTFITHIGNTSFTISHEAWQDNQLKAKGNAIIVHFDFTKQTKKPIPNEIKEKLKKHYKESS